MGVKKISFNQVEGLVSNIISQLNEDNWQPEQIVGISRGGLLPAIMLSHYYDCPMTPLVWSTRDSNVTETNVELASDASAGKHILIVDDIIDSGITMMQIIENWDFSVPGNIKWDETTKVASLHLRSSSEYIPSYTGNKVTSKDWITYPWEIDESEII